MLLFLFLPSSRASSTHSSTSLSITFKRKNNKIQSILKLPANTSLDRHISNLIKKQMRYTLFTVTYLLENKSHKNKTNNTTTLSQIIKPNTHSTNQSTSQPININQPTNYQKQPAKQVLPLNCMSHRQPGGQTDRRWMH